MTNDEVLLTTRGQYASIEWRPVTRGVRRRADAPDPFRAELAAFLEVLPDGARFTHLTAALLRGWWLPPIPYELPVFVALPPGAHRVRRPGVVAIRRSRQSPSVLVNDLPVDSATYALLACARDLGVLDMTCLIDAALAARDVTKFELEQAAHRGVRGARGFRQALALADPRAESIYEVLLRVLHEVTGVPVEPQYDARDEAGLFLARADLRLVGTQVLHEYDGGEHLRRARQRKDRKRDRRLGHSEWIRRGYTREDVLFQAVTILKDADASIGRIHDPSRIRAWHDLLKGSTFTPAGMTLLRGKLGLPSPSGHTEAS